MKNEKETVEEGSVGGGGGVGGVGGGGGGGIFVSQYRRFSD